MSITAFRVTASLLFIAGAVAASIFSYDLWSQLPRLADVSLPEPAGETLDGAQGLELPEPGDKASSILGVDEVYANVYSAQDRAYSFALKLDLELFDSKYRKLLEDREPVVRSAILDAARHSTYGQLSSLPGKLYFKEVLVSRINEAVGLPAVREAHFNSYYLQ